MQLLIFNVSGAEDLEFVLVSLDIIFTSLRALITCCTFHFYVMGKIFGKVSSDLFCFVR